MKDKRTTEGYKLRVYMDAIKDAKAITDDQWVAQWIKSVDAQWIPKSNWIAYLEQCAIGELEKIYRREAA